MAVMETEFRAVMEDVASPRYYDAGLTLARHLDAARALDRGPGCSTASRSASRPSPSPTGSRPSRTSMLARRTLQREPSGEG